VKGRGMAGQVIGKKSAGRDVSLRMILRLKPQRGEIANETLLERRSKVQASSVRRQGQEGVDGMRKG